MNMNKMLARALLVTLACAGTSATAQEQQLDTITVQATRLVATKLVGRTSSGIPVESVSLSYAVSLQGVDLSTPSGMQELEKRINDVALTACEDLGHRYPDSTPDDKTCARDTAKKAIAQLHERAKTAAPK